MCTDRGVAGRSHSLLGGLVGSYSTLPSCQAEKPIGLSKVRSECVCTGVCVCVYARPSVCLWLKLNYNTLIPLILSHYFCQCKKLPFVGHQTNCRMGIKETLNSSGLNGCCGLAAASVLNLSLRSVGWALCPAFPLDSFLLTFLCSFFLLFVKIVHQCSLRLCQWSDPCLNVLGAFYWIAQNKLLLIWSSGVVSLLSGRFIHSGKQ